MKYAILFSITLLAFTACQPRVEGQKTTGKTIAEVAMDSTTLSHDSLPADNAKARVTGQRGGKEE